MYPRIKRYASFALHNNYLHRKIVKVNFKGASKSPTDNFLKRSLKHCMIPLLFTSPEAESKQKSLTDRNAVMTPGHLTAKFKSCSRWKCRNAGGWQLSCPGNTCQTSPNSLFQSSDLQQVMQDWMQKQTKWCRTSETIILHGRIQNPDPTISACCSRQKSRT